MRQHPDVVPTVIQVVPLSGGGVADYAQCLRGQWAREGRASQLLVMSQSSALAQPLAQQVLARMGPVASLGDSRPRSCSLVLHFSGYGYGKRGLCGWVLKELEALKALPDLRVRLLVIFHELFASGPPWRSSFWLSPWQEAIAARVARCADAVWTNADEHARWLRRAVGPAVPLQVQPVFSNVGESDRILPTDARAPSAIVFGSASTRQRVFDALPRFCGTLQRLGVESVIEVGTGPPSRVGKVSIECRHLGCVDPPALGDILKASRFALIDYGASLLSKSGVFAAYAAHGCVVLNTRPDSAPADGLASSRDYISLSTVSAGDVRPFSLDEQTLMAQRLHRWYAGHGVAQQAGAIWSMA